MRAAHPLRAVPLAVVLGLVTSLASAQTRSDAGDLTGTVVDASSTVLPGVTVTATNLSTGITRTVVSRSDGRYEMPALPPGEYTVTAGHPGFVTVKETLVLALGESRRIDVVLQLGRSDETVVAGVAPLLDPRRTAVSMVISQQQIGGLPTNGRDFMAFSVLAPGVGTDRTPYQGAVATSGLTFAGQSARFNNITVDGLDNNDVTVGGVRATFSQGAVREFQVVANSYSAEFGKATGGLVNIVTHSGGNRWTGDAFLYIRDQTLNARDHFEMFDAAGNRLDQGKAPYSRYQLGGTFGGPLQRNRSFFFLSAEGLRSQANNFVNIDNTTHITAFGTDYGTVVDILERAGFPVEVGHLPYRVDANQVVARLDTKPTEEHQLTLRVNWGDLLNENVEHWGGQIARSRGAALDSRDMMAAVLLTSVFPPRTVNELRFQVAYHDQDMRSFDPRCSGTCDRDDEGGPTLEIGAIAVGRQRFTPQPRTDVRYQVVDTLTREAGRHQLKAGLDYSYIDQRRQRLPLHFGGRYVFQDLSASRAASVGLPGPVNALQALALGAPSSYLQGYGNAGVSGPYHEISLFAEDEWRATDRLTLKLGVRYQNQFWPALIEHVPGLPAYGWPSDNNNVAPRVAISWQPGARSRTTVHGSYGIYYDNLITSLWGLAAGINGAADHVQTLSLRRTDAYMAWRTPDRKWPQPAGSFSVFAYSIQPGLKTPYAHHASVGLEHELGRYRVSASAVFVRGFNRVGSIDYPTATGNWRQYTSWGESSYRGLLLSLRRPFGDRFGLLASYTWSKADDLFDDFAFQQPMDRGDGRNPEDPAGLPLGFDPQSEKGPSLQDQRHRLVLSGVFTMPGGLMLSGIVTAGSGRPYNILAGSDLNGNQDGGSGPSDRPWRIPGDQTTFIGRNTGRLPATMTVDLRVTRRLDLGDRTRLDLMVDAFNLFNRTNYTQINNVFGSGAYPTDPLPTFGQFTEAGPPLQVQLAARVSFGGSR